MMRFNIHLQATEAVVLRGRRAQTIYIWTFGHLEVGVTLSLHACIAKILG